MNPYADMYPGEWTPPCPQEEQAAEGWMDYQEQKQHDE